VAKTPVHGCMINADMPTFQNEKVGYIADEPREEECGEEKVHSGAFYE